MQILHLPTGFFSNLIILSSFKTAMSNNDGNDFSDDEDDGNIPNSKFLSEINKLTE